jgi:hypothetical protein
VSLYDASNERHGKSCLWSLSEVAPHLFSCPKRTKLNRVAKPTYGGDVYDVWGVFDGLILRAATVVKAGGLKWVGDSVLFTIFTFHPGHPEDTKMGIDTAPLAPNRSPCSPSGRISGQGG